MKTKRIRVPLALIDVMEREIKQIEKEGKRVREPTQLEVLERIANVSAKQLFIKRRRY